MLLLPDQQQAVCSPVWFSGNRSAARTVCPLITETLKHPPVAGPVVAQRCYDVPGMCTAPQVVVEFLCILKHLLHTRGQVGEMAGVCSGTQGSQGDMRGGRYLHLRYVFASINA